MKNNLDNETYILYDTSKLVRELEFDGEYLDFYITTHNNEYVDLPYVTQTAIVKWIRENFKIVAFAEPCRNLDDELVYVGKSININDNEPTIGGIYISNNLYGEHEIYEHALEDAIYNVLLYLKEKKL